MPSVRPQQMVDAILDAISDSGSTGALTSRAQQHPRRFLVAGPDGPEEIWVYAWTLTPGGRPQLANEYRIQMTSVVSPLAMNPAGPTLLLGFEPSLKVFAGFDLRRHRTFTTGSPSVQVGLDSLRAALQDGIAFHRKSNGELTVAFRPEQMLTYSRSALDLHRSGADGKTVRLLQRASAREPIVPAQLRGLSVERRKLVQTVTRLSRSANFADQVLGAYDKRCAVTRVQLRLVEAAHILPVVAPDSPDHVTNGVALSPTYHRAFDAGLIFLDEQHVMRVNPKRLSLLASLGLDGGLEDFSRPLGRIHLPADRLQYPAPELIRKANAFRRI